MPDGVTQVPVLRMAGVTKRFPGVRALDNASLEVLPGEVHGLVGENGAGKSTIIKVLAGVYSPDGGEISIRGRQIAWPTPVRVHQLGIRFVHQELHLVPHFTVAESVFMGNELSSVLGLRVREMRRRTRDFLLEHLGADLDPGTLIRDLGPTERKLVQIARALVDDGASLVVFDEPTAPLAAEEIDRVFAAIRLLRERGIACLYVSHYLAEITALCDRVTVFRNGSDVGCLSAADATDHGALIRMMVGRELGRMFPDRTDPKTGETALAVRGLGDGSRFSDVSFEARRGEILGLAGLAGSGREELVDALAGLRRVRHGSLEVSGRRATFRSPADALRHGLALVPRDRRRDGLVLDMTAAENGSLATLDRVASHGLVRRGLMQRRAAEMAKRLDVRPPEPGRFARLFSGGNQQKLVLARWLAADARVLVFDEPTLGVDIGAKAEIYRLMGELADRGTAVVVSSNDMEELCGMCDRILVLLRGSVIAVVTRGEVDLGGLVALTTGARTSRAGGGDAGAAPASASSVGAEVER
jgi:ribose transport system ATP-binding protein